MERKEQFLMEIHTLELDSSITDKHLRTINEESDSFWWTIPFFVDWRAVPATQTKSTDFLINNE